MTNPPKGLDRVHEWFESKGWTPYQFQCEAWQAYARGQSGLIHVPTGAGKTYAAFMAPLAHLIDMPKDAHGLRILYITPLKAVARDIHLALQAPVTDLALPFKVQSRTGDTTQSQRLQQKKVLPEILITTPESLALLLSYEESAERFAKIQTVIIDEWHELLQTKRATLLELQLVRLRQIQPEVRTWALTATLSNLKEAAYVACGVGSKPVVICAELQRPTEIISLLPDQIDSFPWAGHLGVKMVIPLGQWLDPRYSTLIFTNTRSQAERWYQFLLDAKPEWTNQIAIHHGSLDRKERERVEKGIKDGTLNFVVCTSSLDLGVDFGLVERVVQIGSPKGIARLIQRAGRASHRPGARCLLLFVPTHALELVEIAAARQAIERQEIESRHCLNQPMDVLVQHLVTRALGGGFTFSEILNEVRTSVAFQNLSAEELQWALELVMHGGTTLKAYELYHKVILQDGRYIVPKPRIARLHRMNIGTIVSDTTVQLCFQRGKKIGQIEESFISKLKKGDRFAYGGRTLEFIRMQNLSAQVRLARGKASIIPTWQGGRLPFSESISHAMRAVVDETSRGLYLEPEIRAVQSILLAQTKLSALPRMNQILCEIAETREGHHLFIYPFEGRPLHEGLSTLIALRLATIQKATFSITVNDYGFELLCPVAFPYINHLKPALFATEHLIEDLIKCMNMAALAKMQFREIARIAGLVLQNSLGSAKSTRQVQVSSSLLFDVFQKYDPENLLLKQAQTQVIERQIENSRLGATLERLRNAELCVRSVRRPTPLGFPLIAERLSARLSSESLVDRLQRLKDQWTSVT